MTARRQCAHMVACLVVALAGVAEAQTAVSPSAPPQGGSGASSTRAATSKPSATDLKPEELEQVVAPVALYPDSLLAQVFMASTYPLEVVQAERWGKQNPKLVDNPQELNKLPWDPSVKSLLDFPQVLNMMSEKLDWTVKLGDAFLADRKAVMDAVQSLRKKAYDQGNLKTTEQQKVTVQEAPAVAGSAPAPATAAPATAAPAQSSVIVVESANPSVVYVPTYNPTVVYGTWPYPAYPPYYYAPPGYAAGSALVGFGVGVAVGAAWGHAWGHCNWNGGDVDIDVNRNINVNQNINRNAYRNQYNNINNRVGAGAGGGRGGGSWQHDTSHRKGVAYRDSATTERYRGAGSSQQMAQSREAYRGRADAGRQDLARGNADSYRGSPSGYGSNRSSTGGYRTGSSQTGGYRTGSSQTGGYRTGSSSGRSSSASSRDYSGTRSSSFSGVDSGRSSTRSASSRGQASRSSSYSGGSGSYSGGGRSGGSSGGGRAGGGGGGGRGGGGRR